MDLLQLVPILLIFGVFWLLVIRPDVKRQESHRAMVDALTKDDPVVTIGGVHGVVVSVGEKVVEIEIARGVRVKVDKTAIARKGVEASTSNPSA
ncbi:MAG TPA: preprotein translocase subunit YajC [Plasticicumulans sp.]|nr:preprotein translocase subunit YajC [Plasticicumulans sp.]